MYYVYAFLKNVFKGNVDLIKQTESLYIKFVQERNNKTEKIPGTFRYIFPFDYIEKNERIILYGAGTVGMDYYMQLSKVKYCQIVLWVDKRYRQYKNVQISDPNLIQCVDYDKIVVAAKNIELQKEIRMFLMSIGVKEQVIISGNCLE